ncbi:hypothetical protein GDO86_006891 [Hymenochirus boettgeri]|uniref:BESS domain-containing protein n=2 Tax=Hymenochirus boettgeri TaxID=247094 RepID=A0A8T2JCN4_9PIPI|nr:hypothetical protein GDO86_006891 [Hymenochirus boettgeri]
MDPPRNTRQNITSLSCTISSLSHRLLESSCTSNQLPLPLTSLPVLGFPDQHISLSIVTMRGNYITQEEEDEPSVKFSAMEHPASSGLFSQEITERHPPTTLRRRKRKANKDDVNQKILDEAAAILAKPDDEIDAFAFFIASKIRRMDEDQRLLCEPIIAKLIQKGLENKLNEHTKIVTNTPPSYGSSFPDTSTSQRTKSHP